MNSFTIIKPYIKKERQLIIFGLISLLVVDTMLLIIPRIIKAVVDTLAALVADNFILIKYVFFILGASLTIGIARFLWRRCLLGFSKRIEKDLRNSLFSHIQKLSASYFNKTKTGDLMAHVTNDIKHIRMATGMGIVALTDSILLGSAAIGFMAYINVKLTLMAIIPMPIIVLSTRFFSKKMHKHYQKVQGTFADMTEVVRERFAGIRIIKAYNMEETESKTLGKISNKFVDDNIGLIKVTGLLFPLMIFFTNVSLTIVLFFGGSLAIMSTISPGDFVAFISYLNLLTWPMMAMGWVMNLIQRGKASLDRIAVILNTEPEIVNNKLLIKNDSLNNNISFKDTTFHYSKENAAALKNINLEIKSGSTLGIVGPPGSGKTTLINLIPRIYDIKEGEILLNDINIHNLDLNELRSKISFMQQEPFLFSGTMRENITFNQNDIDDSQLQRAVKNSSLENTIKNLPEGLDTVVGEKGIILSGGQKQRVSLCRALLSNNPILILDDPISQVDTSTGSEIIETINTLEKEKTIIITSHRFSAIKNADQIIVLMDGSIIEMGTHEKLMELNNYYAKTYNLQILEEEFNEVY